MCRDHALGGPRSVPVELASALLEGFYHLFSVRGYVLVSVYLFWALSIFSKSFFFIHFLVMVYLRLFWVLLMYSQRKVENVG